jgi:NAD(P)-dependent dehydrogenase (short-subunit alcohol dehydrogenase family)
MSVWFVTGASRGFGLEIVRAALARGDEVVAGARRPEKIREAFPDARDSLLTPRLDVTRREQADRSVAEAVAKFGRIDVLVNDAGRGMLGAVEEVSDEEARAVFEVNVFGLLTVTRAVLPVMRDQRAGKVFNMSSSGGFVARAGWGVYSATKFAVEGLGESLGHEVGPLGIEVVAIEPGGFRTDFLDDSSLVSASRTIDDYAGTAGEIRDWAESTNHVQPGDPRKAAEAIVGLADRSGLPERIQLGEDCLELVAEKLARTARDQEEWRDVSVSTGFETAIGSTTE